jgi:phage tail protein X
MLNIAIDIGGKEYRVQSDSYNFMICRMYHNKKTDTVDWKPIKFYGNLSSLFEDLLRLKLRASDATSIAELAINMKRYRDEIQGAYETHFDIKETA